jgi:hypothetical protein
MGNPNRKSAQMGGCCSMHCLEDLQWKETLYIMGKDYFPRQR